MSEERADEEFWNVVDSFINLANEQMGKIPAGKVSSALMFAASRFNAHIVASVEDVDLAEEKASAIRHFVGEYEKMLTQNLEDYEKNPN